MVYKIALFIFLICTSIIFLNTGAVLNIGTDTLKLLYVVGGVGALVAGIALLAGK